MKPGDEEPHQISHHSWFWPITDPPKHSKSGDTLGSGGGGLCTVAARLHVIVCIAHGLGRRASISVRAEVERRKVGSEWMSIGRCIAGSLQFHRQRQGWKDWGVVLWLDCRNAGFWPYILREKNVRVRMRMQIRNSYLIKLPNEFRTQDVLYRELTNSNQYYSFSFITEYS